MRGLRSKLTTNRFWCAVREPSDGGWVLTTADPLFPFGVGHLIGPNYNYRFLTFGHHTFKFGKGKDA